MAQFTYLAVNEKGESVNGNIEATDRAAAVATLSKKKLRPIHLKSGTPSSNDLSNIFDRFFNSKVKTNTLVIFTRQLSTMIGAGVPLLRALNALKSHADNPLLKSTLDKIIDDIQGGSALADSMSKHPRVFSDVYVNMVRAGEAAGILEEVLERLALQQEKNNAIRKKVKGAMTYPAVLLVVTTAAFFGLMLFVIPRISVILKSLGGQGAQLPALTQVMLGISSFVQNFWWLIILILVGGVFLITRYVRTPTGKKNFHTLILKLPIVKSIVIKVCVARFARTFASLMSAGVGVVGALQVTGRAVGNVVYQETLDNAIDEIKSGKQLSEIIANNPLFPDIVSQMLAVGEETGQTDTVLIKVADFYEEEVDVVVNSLGSIIEPVMIILMGAMVGLIAASVIMPITSLAQNVKG